MESRRGRKLTTVEKRWRDEGVMEKSNGIDLMMVGASLSFFSLSLTVLLLPLLLLHFCLLPPTLLTPPPPSLICESHVSPHYFHPSFSVISLSSSFLCFSHECIIGARYTQPCFQFFPVAFCGIATKYPPGAKKAFFPQTTTVRGTSVNLLTGHLQIQTQSIITLCFVYF